MNTVGERTGFAAEEPVRKTGSLEAASRTNAGARVTFVDNARALGIVLVVLGHAPALAGWASDFIFAFHMPLFFCLSGLLVGTDRLALKTVRRTAQLARTLLLPYLFFFLLSYAYWLVAKRHGLRAAEFEALPWWQPLVGFVQGTADGLYFNVVLWFFPCLFITSVVHHALRKYFPGPAVAVLSTIAAFLFVMLRTGDEPRWWWSADCAVIGLAFFSVGAACNAMLRHERLPDRRTLVLLAASLIPATLLLSRITGHVDLNHLSFGAHPVLYLPVGLIGTLGVLAASGLLPGSATGRWLSQNTVIIFPMHFILFSVITGVAIVVLGLPADVVKGQSLAPLEYTAMALLLCWPVSIVLQRPLRLLMHFRLPTATGRPS